MMETYEHDRERLLHLADVVSDVLEEHIADNAEVIAVCLYIAVKVCDAMHMNKSIFMLNCDLIYDAQSENFMRDEGETLQ